MIHTKYIVKSDFVFCILNFVINETKTYEYNKNNINKINKTNIIKIVQLLGYSYIINLI